MARKAGIALLTEDRKRSGLLFNLPLRGNITIGNLDLFARRGIVSSQSEDNAAVRAMRELNVKARSSSATVSHLSGGNQQKLLFARVLMNAPKILLLDEPTKGVDVGTRHEIYRLIVELAGKGVGLVVVSSELEEVIGLCDRNLVLADGRLVDEFVKADASEERVLRAIAARRRQGRRRSPARRRRERSASVARAARQSSSPARRPASGGRRRSSSAHPARGSSASASTRGPGASSQSAPGSATRQFCFATADVTREADVRAAVAAMLAAFGRIDGVVNSAGVNQTDTRLEEMTDDVWDLTIAVNLTAIFRVCRAALPELRRAGGGSVVNIASVHALATVPGVPAYAASKGGVLALSKQIALDYAVDFIRVNALIVGSVDTRMTRTVLDAAGGAEKLGLSFERNVIARIAKPEEIATAIAFLLSDDASFVTGSGFVVDGGMTTLLF